MQMYDTENTDDFNITLDGYQMIMEECTPNEAFNRRETIRHNIIGGTQTVMRGNYLPRDYTFTTHFLVDPNHPDVYDSIIREWQSRPVTVVSKYMGGKFDAEVIIKKSPCTSPNYLAMEIQVIEIPGSKSLIPNDDFIIPGDKVVPISVSSAKKSKKTSSKKSSSKTVKKNSSKKSSSKKKGGKITKTNKNNE